MLRVTSRLNSSSGNEKELKKTGNGTLELTGGGAINPLSLKVLWAANSDVVLDGATIELTNTGTSPEMMTYGGNITIQGGADVRMTDANGWGYVREGVLTVTGAGSSFTCDKLFASSANTYDTAGTIVVQNSGAVEVTGITKFSYSYSSLTIDGGTFETGQLTNRTGWAETVRIADPDASTPALTVGTNNGNSTFDGLIQDVDDPDSLPGSLKKVGSGTFTLTGANTYSGGTIVDGGTLNLTGENTSSGMTNINAGKIIVGHANALGDSTVSINIDDGLDVTTNSIDATIGGLAGSGNLNLGSQTLVTGGNGADTTYSGVISGTSDSTLRYNGAGTLTLTGAGSNFGFLRAGGWGTLVLDDFDATLTKGSDFDALSVLYGELIVSNGSTINTTSKDVTAWTNGTLTVTGSGTQVTSGSVVYVIYGGEFIVEDFADVTGNEAYIGARQTTTGSGTLTVSSGGSVGISGITAVGEDSGDVGDLAITGAGSSFSTGHLKLGGYGYSNLGGTANVSVDDGGSLTVDGTTTFFTSVSNMTIDGGSFETNELTNDTGVIATVSITDPDTPALTVGINDGSSTFDGLIQNTGSGKGSLEKVGSGTFTLTGANTYSGDTTIADGILLANNTSGSATGTGRVMVNSRGTLGGTGSVAGPVTIAIGGTLAPGASAESLSLGGDLALESGSTLAIELGGTDQGGDYDFIDVTGNVTLNDATLDVTLLDPFTPGIGQAFDILDFASLSGTFDQINLPTLGSRFEWDTSAIYTTGMLAVLYDPIPGDANRDGTVNDADAEIVSTNWQTPSGATWDMGDFNGDYAVNDIDATIMAANWQSSVISSVPEPGTLTLLAICGLALLGLGARRWKR